MDRDVIVISDDEEDREENEVSKSALEEDAARILQVPTSTPSSTTTPPHPLSRTRRRRATSSVVDAFSTVVATARDEQLPPRGAAGPAVAILADELNLPGTPRIGSFAWKLSPNRPRTSRTLHPLEESRLRRATPPCPHPQPHRHPAPPSRSTLTRDAGTFNAKKLAHLFMAHGDVQSTKFALDAGPVPTV